MAKDKTQSTEKNDQPEFTDDVLESIRESMYEFGVKQLKMSQDKAKQWAKRSASTAYDPW